MGMEGTEQGQAVVSARRTKTKDPLAQVTFRLAWHMRLETSGVTFNQRMNDRNSLTECMLHVKHVIFMLRLL